MHLPDKSDDGPSAPEAVFPLLNTPAERAGRIRTHHLQRAKNAGVHFAMLTAYEQNTAEIFDQAGIEVLLVGDSASNNVFGNETSLPVTVDELLPLFRAVARSAKRSLVVADLPVWQFTKFQRNRPSPRVSGF
jgi:3-methyl-2-oxobutanoate hydroxymethyltransferase